MVEFHSIMTSCAVLDRLFLNVQAHYTSWDPERILMYGTVLVMSLLLVYIVFDAIKSQRVPSLKVELPDGGDGEAMGVPDHRRIPCYDPGCSKLLGYGEAMTAAEVVESVERARQAAAVWGDTSFHKRRQLMRVLLKYIINHQDEICRVSALDSGKTSLEAVLGEVLVTCEKLQWLIHHGEEHLKPERRVAGAMAFYKIAQVEFHPVGVVGAIVPWNWPFHNIMNPLSAALFAGNAIVIKVSEHACWSLKYYSAIIHEALRAVDAPLDLVQFVTGYGDVGHALVTSGVDKIIFVGSDAVGRKVMAAAAEKLTPVTLELGGKDAFIVCEDADLNQVVPIAVKAAFLNCGQNCAGGERFLVHSSIYGQYLEEVLKVVRNMRQGHGVEVVDCGAMCMPGGPQKVHDLVTDAISQGAQVLAGGELPASGAGTFYPPTVLTGVRPSMRIWHEEVFGPVMTVVPFTTEEEALALANDCPYGLGSSVFTRSAARARRLGKGLKAGMTSLNDFNATYMCQSLPFGGVKDSGFGRFAGVEGLRALCIAKSVCEDRWPWLMKTTIPGPLQHPVTSRSYPFAQCLATLFYGPGLSYKVSAVLRLLFLLVRAPTSTHNHQDTLVPGLSNKED